MKKDKIRRTAKIDMGMIDLDLRPREIEIRLDGELKGWISLTGAGLWGSRPGWKKKYLHLEWEKVLDVVEAHGGLRRSLPKAKGDRKV